MPSWIAIMAIESSSKLAMYTVMMVLANGNVELSNIMWFTSLRRF